MTHTKHLQRLNPTMMYYERDSLPHGRTVMTSA